MSTFMNTELRQTFLEVNVINLINERLYLSTFQEVKIVLISEFVTAMKLQRASTDSHEKGYQNHKNIIPIK